MRRMFAAWRAFAVKAPWRAQHRQPLHRGPVQLQPLGLLMCSHLVHGEHGRERHVGLDQQFFPFGTRALDERRLHHTHDLFIVCRNTAVVIGAKTRVVDEVFTPDDARQRSPEFLRHRKMHDDATAVRRLQQKILRLRMARIAHRALAGLEGLRKRVHGERGHGLQQRCLHQRALTVRVAFPAEQGGQNAHGAGDAGDQIGNAGARQTAVLRIIHDRIETADALPDGVVGRPVHPWATAAKTRDRCIDEMRIDRAAFLLTQPQRIHLAGSHVLDDHVELGQHRLHKIHTRLRLQVDRNAFLARVVLDEVGTAIAFATAEGFALRRLDLHHLGTQRSQNQAAIRRRNIRTDFQNADASKRLGFHDFLFPVLRNGRAQSAVFHCVFEFEFVSHVGHSGVWKSEMPISCATVLHAQCSRSKAVSRKRKAITDDTTAAAIT
ncbi:hypothetical protein SDC9_106448 [bioreactor metagenome]|uniref:Uncharacterized protein n=1 Tax=bioreactor metagenome TaxID=1076179 RepID=A0A645B8Z0_9ZZZZ